VIGDWKSVHGKIVESDKPPKKNKAKALPESGTGDAKRCQGTLDVAAADEQQETAQLPQRPKATEPFESEDRTCALRGIFRLFDLDAGGTIEIAELRLLGEARREAGQKQTEWDAAKNAWMFRMVDEDGSGTVDQQEFVDYFLRKHAALSPPEFTTVLAQYKVTAQLAASKAPKTLASSKEQVPGLSLFFHPPSSLTRYCCSLSLPPSTPAPCPRSLLQESSLSCGMCARP
jgi:hypothetical protein